MMGSIGYKREERKKKKEKKRCFYRVFSIILLPFPPCVERVRRTFSLPDGVLLPCDHGLDF